jgi:hypothetical protein
LPPWEGSVTWRGGVATLPGGETKPMRGKGVDDVGWVDVNLIGPKNKENLCGRFSCYMGGEDLKQ